LNITLNINRQQTEKKKRRERKMRKMTFTIKAVVALGVLALSCGLAQAGGATRTWVSGVGSDINPCSRTAPCQTFAGAYAKTAVGGTINVIDAGGFGAVTIDHSITIDGSESFASILMTADYNGITVNADSADVVVLRGLNIMGGGNYGIRFLAGGRLYVEDCRIFSFLQRGIDFEPSGKSQLFLKDTIVRNNVAAGVYVQSNGLAQVTIDHCRLEGNQNGLSVLDSSKVTIRNSVLSSNKSNGVLVQASADSTEVNVANCMLTNNGADGIKVSGSNGNKGRVRLSGSTVTGNDTGLDILAGGFIDSYGDNNVDGNISANGAPTGTIPQQ
jgi:hypothetical protein